MEKVDLAECAQIIRGVSFDSSQVYAEHKEGLVPILRAGNIQNELDVENDLIYVPQKFVSDEQMLKPGDIAIATSSGSFDIVGKTASLNKDWFGSVGAFCAIIRPQKISSKLLEFFFRSHEFKVWKLSKNLGANIKNLRISELNEVKVPSFNNTYEKQLVDLLDKADSIRKKRQQQIKLADEFLRSTFLEMFGDPVASKIKKYPLKEFTEINPIKSEIINRDNNLMVSFVPMSSVGENGELTLNDERILADVLKGFTYFKENDVLFAKITPCMENGKGTIARGLKNNIGFGSTEFHILRPKEGNTSEWLFYLTHNSNFRKLAETRMTGSAGQKRVPSFFLEEIRIPKPDQKLQSHFTKLVNKTNYMKIKYYKSYLESENLFNSLMQKAFSGKL